MSFGACEVSTSIKDARVGELIHAALEYQKVKVGRNLTTISESWEHGKIYDSS